MNKHSENQNKVCLLCLKYIPQFKHSANKVAKLLFLKKTHEKAIQTTFISVYRFEDNRWPKVVCKSCSPKLFEALKGKLRRSWTPYNTGQILESVVYSFRFKSCSCFICNVVKNSTNVSQLRKSHVGKTHLKKKPAVDHHLCSKCLSVIGKGVNHVCARHTLLRNAEHILKSKSIEEQVTSKIVKEKDNGNQVAVLKNSHGKESQVYLNKPPAIPTFSLEDIIEIQQEQGNSERKQGKLLKKLRQKKCKIETNVPKKLQSTTDEVASFFSVESVMIEVGEKKTRSLEQRPLVFCNRPYEYAHFVAVKRGFDPLEVITIMACDAGDNSLKVGFSIAPVTGPSINRNGRQYSGVKKIHILALVQNTPETYANIRTVFHKMDLRDPTKLPGQAWITGDFKMTNKLIGVQEHSCTFPCAYCDIRKDDLKKGKTYSSIRTFGTIRQCNQDWINAGRIEKNLPKYKSCFAVPIFDEIDDSAPISDIIAPGELHEMTGVTMHIYKHMRQFDPDGVDSWIQSLHIKSQAWSGDFNGNAVKKMLNNYSTLKNFLNPSMHFYSDIFGSLNKLVDACFSYELDPEYEAAFDHFEWIINEHGIPYTPKLHILLTHVLEFLHKHNMGLGAVSEQAIESLHHLWKVFFVNFKFGPDDQSNALIRGISKFNSQNI